MKKSTEKRLDEINKYLLVNQSATTKQLADLTGVSPEMIRKDLLVLEQKGNIKRYHGGASMISEEQSVPFSARIYKNKQVKNEICTIAIDFINDGDFVYIDPSTTALQLGRLLRMKRNVTVITNCIEFLKFFDVNSSNKCILLGGEYSKTGDRTLGFITVDAIKKLHFDKAFFGSDGLKNLLGPGTISESEMSINEAVLKRSDKNILMVDSSKFTKKSNYVYGSYSMFDVFITDNFDSNYKDIINIKNIIETSIKLN